MCCGTQPCFTVIEFEWCDLNWVGLVVLCLDRNTSTSGHKTKVLFARFAYDCKLNK